MEVEIFNPKVIKYTKTMDLVQVTAEPRYCVRRKKSSFFNLHQITFADLNRNGVDYTFDDLCSNVTLGSYIDAERVFNSLAVKNQEEISIGERDEITPNN